MRGLEMRRAPAVLALLAGLAAAGTCRAGEENVGSTSANFLKISTDSRPAALGEAYTALSDDEAGLGANPAGLANALQSGISATHVQWFQFVQLDHLAGVLPVEGMGTFGAAVTWMGTGSQDVTVRDNPGSPDPLTRYSRVSSFWPYDLELSLAYARPVLGRVALGAQLEMLEQDINTSTGIGFDASFGAHLADVFKGLDAGLSINHVGLPIQTGAFPLYPPTSLHAGFVYGPWNHLFDLSLESALPNDHAPSLGGGLETWVADILALRAGCQTGAETLAALGMGFCWKDVKLDYAFVPYADLGSTHRVTLGYAFGNPAVRISSDKKVAAPLGSEPYRLVNLSLQGPSPSRMRSWEVALTGPSGIRVKKFQGKGAAPSKIVWDGKDEEGRIVPDGLVAMEFRTIYRRGIQARPGSAEVEMDSTPPATSFDLEPKIIITNSRGAVQIPAHLKLGASDLHGVGAWRLDIMDSKGGLVNTFAGKGEPGNSLFWDGKNTQGNYIESGQTYTSRFWARDTLGNWSKPLDATQTIVLKEIKLELAADANFGPGSDTLDATNQDLVKNIASNIRNRWKPGTVIEVIGHSDNIPLSPGRYPDNQALSEARARSVAEALKPYLGPEAAWLKASGKGESQPVADNATPEGRARNRRVVVIVRVKEE